jgi:hypothetical protein
VVGEALILGGEEGVLVGTSLGASEGADETCILMSISTIAIASKVLMRALFWSSSACNSSCSSASKASTSRVEVKGVSEIDLKNLVEVIELERRSLGSRIRLETARSPLARSIPDAVGAQALATERQKTVLENLTMVSNKGGGW